MIMIIVSICIPTLLHKTGISLLRAHDPKFHHWEMKLLSNGQPTLTTRQGESWNLGYVFNKLTSSCAAAALWTQNIFLPTTLHQLACGWECLSVPGKAPRWMKALIMCEGNTGYQSPTPAAEHKHSLSKGKTPLLKNL